MFIDKLYLCHNWLSLVIICHCWKILAVCYRKSLWVNSDCTLLMFMDAVVTASPRSLWALHM